MDTSTTAAAVVGSFILTHVLMACMQRLRLRRIERKSLELCEEPVAAPSAGDAARLPITVVTGFLGSGKTTLVNRVLTGGHGRRVVVIENEVGAISIDHELIDEAAQARAPAGVRVLKNGCMCCAGETPGSELERVLDQLLKMRRDAGTTPPFDYVLIETSGLADVAPIIQVLWRHEMERSPYYLDGVVAVVDCAHILRHLRPSTAFGFARRRVEAERQLSYADRVVLNKLDLLADAAALAAVEAAVRELNPTAGMLRATHAAVDVDALLDQQAFSSARWERALNAQEEQQPGAAPFSAPAHGATRVATVCLQVDAPLRLSALQGWLQELIGARERDLYRMKGLLHVAGDERRFVLHGTHAQVQGHFDRVWPEGARRSVLVVIGIGLSHSELQTGLLRCCADAGAEGGCTPCDVEDDDFEVVEAEPDGGAGARRRRGVT